MSLAFVLAAVLASSTPTSTGVELRFEPRAGSVVRKNFEQRLDLRLEEVSFDVRDERRKDDPRPMRVDGVGRSEVRHLEWTDTYQVVDAERVQRLRRSFEQLDTSVRQRWDGVWRGPAGSETNDGRSALTSKAILFDWDTDLDDYRATAEPFEYVDREQLDALRVDADVAGVLPGRRVAVGDEWRIGTGVLRELVRPGGSIQFELAGGSVFDEFLADTALAALEGELRVVLTDIDEDDANCLATMRVEGRLEGHLSSEGNEESFPFPMVGDLGPGLVRRSISRALELRGEIVWNVRARHLHGVHLNARVEYAGEGTTRPERGGWEFASAQTWRGELELNVEVEP